MENVPYGFVQSVLSRLDEGDLRRIVAISDAPLWSSAAWHHLEQLKCLDARLSIGENGILFFNCQLSDERVDHPPTIPLDDVIQMDERFVRIVDFFVNTKSPADCRYADQRLEILMERLAEVIRFVSQFRIENLEIMAECPYFLKLLEEELIEHPINTERLVLNAPGMERFLKTQLARQEVTFLVLCYEHYSEAIRVELEAFACSPQFEVLRGFGQKGPVCGKTPKFDFKTLIRIIASWKRRRGKRPCFMEVPTIGNLAEKFSALMRRDPDCENSFLEETDEYSIQVKCFDDRTEIKRL